MQNLSHPVIIFDGYCNLCNSVVNFIIRKDKRRIFRYSPLQSKFSQKNLPTGNINLEFPESVILFNEGRLYQKSRAVVEIFKLLPYPWKTFSLIQIIPKFLRDKCYKTVSQKRYKIFGKRDICMIPSKEIKDLFFN